MKKLLISLLAIAAIVACDDNGANEKPGPTPKEDVINIVVDTERLSAYQVAYSIYPDDKDAYFYCDVMSKARWESANINEVKAEFDAALHSYAEMVGNTYEEVCEQMLFKGDVEDFFSNAGYRGDTDFVIYAFYWSDSPVVENVSVAEFRTPSHVDSTENVAISFDGVEPYEMNVRCVPTDGVDLYYYYFAETEKVEKMLEELEDENAYMSYHAMNVGIKYKGEQTLSQKGLKAETSYTAIVMAIDKQGNRMQTSMAQTTASIQQNERVESPLFESLIGEWSGVQTIYDGYAEPFTSEFTVTIAANIDGYNYDYRENNQLVALVDGWCNIGYYGIEALRDAEIENPEAKFGPKWTLDIAEGDVVTIDGYAHYSVVGWMFFGDCFMLSADHTTANIVLDTTLGVEVSKDGNTLTICSPVEGCYPSLAYNFDGFGWMAYYFGLSDIVLTRK